MFLYRGAAAAQIITSRYLEGRDHLRSWFKGAEVVQCGSRKIRVRPQLRRANEDTWEGLADACSASKH